jgi:anti-sigma factor RsiW
MKVRREVLPAWSRQISLSAATLARKVAHGRLIGRVLAAGRVTVLFAEKRA